MTKYLVDTNVLLRDDLGKLDVELVITSHVLRELENHKRNKNGELAYQARKATRYIEENSKKFEFDLNDYSGILGENFDYDYVDNKLIECCIANNFGIITRDLLLKMKARGFNIPIFTLEETQEDIYKGVHDVHVDSTSQEGQEILSLIYEVPEKNIFDLRENEYVVIWDKSKPMYDEENELVGYEVIDRFKWQGSKFVKLKQKALNSKFIGRIRPVNVKQELLFDMMQNDTITVKACFGKFGTGKDFVMIAHAIEAIETHKFEKIIWVRNNVELKDSEPIGFLPGDKNDKLIEFAMPLADHLGGIEGLRVFMERRTIEIQHIGTLRGRDIKNSIIYVTEVQNNTSEHIKLLLGRVGEGSQLWLNGDLKQVDKDKFASNSGLRALTKLKGNTMYGQVTLDKTERSETAALAELI